MLCSILDSSIFVTQARDVEVVLVYVTTKQRH